MGRGDCRSLGGFIKQTLSIAPGALGRLILIRTTMYPYIAGIFFPSRTYILSLVTLRSHDILTMKLFAVKSL